jgi:hypothetical protein
MKIRILSVLAAGALLLAGAAQAAEGSVEPRPTPVNGDAYIKTAIVGIEKGRSGVRLANFLDEPTRNYVNLYGVAEARVLGRAEVEVPAKASLQFKPEQIPWIVTAPINWDQPLVIYVENGRQKQLWQHLQYDPSTGTLSNASICVSPPHQDYAAVDQVAINVFTSRIQRHVSLITLHNFSDADAAFEARLYDFRTGAHVGTANLEIKAHGTFSDSAQWFETEADFQPHGGQPYINIVFVPVNPAGGARLVVGHAMLDMTMGNAVNVSNPCSIHGGIVQLPYVPAQE